MNCPVCGKKMLIKESFDLQNRPVTFAVCNNFCCNFDEELEIELTKSDADVILKK